MQQLFQSKQQQQNAMSAEGPVSRETAESAEDLVSKVKALERDLYYYRKTSRDLRKKLQSMGVSERGSGTGVTEVIKMAEDEHVNSAPELERHQEGAGLVDGGRGQERTKKKHKGHRGGERGTGESVTEDKLVSVVRRGEIGEAAQTQGWSRDGDDDANNGKQTDGEQISLEIRPIDIPGGLEQEVHRFARRAVHGVRSAVPVAAPRVVEVGEIELVDVFLDHQRA